MPGLQLLEDALMLGWEVSVMRLNRESGEELVCHWIAPPGGLKWLDALVQAGRATDLGGDGYPCSYSASAEVLLPALLKKKSKYFGPLIIGDDYVIDSDFRSTITWRNQAALFGDPQEQFRIEAWDRS